MAVGMTRGEARHSAMFQEFEHMDVSAQGRVPKEVVRRGGGFNLV